MSYNPRRLHLPRFAILFLSHSHSEPFPYNGQVFPGKYTFQQASEIVKRSIWHACDSLSPESNRYIYNVSIEHKVSNTRRRTLPETTGYDNSRTTQGSESLWKRLAERVSVVFSRLEYEYHSLWQSVTHLAKFVW